MTEDGLVDADAIAVLLNIPRDTVLDRRLTTKAFETWLRV
jgi:hypothetical protein